VGNDPINAKRPGQKKLPEVDVDTDKDPPHLTVDVHLRVGRRLGTAGEAIGHGHDLAEPHTGIMAI
jgi:hypothetical protein